MEPCWHDMTLVIKQWRKPKTFSKFQGEHKTTPFWTWQGREKETRKTPIQAIRNHILNFGDKCNRLARFQAWLSLCVLILVQGFQRQGNTGIHTHSQGHLDDTSIEGGVEKIVERKGQRGESRERERELSWGRRWEVCPRSEVPPRTKRVEGKGREGKGRGRGVVGVSATSPSSLTPGTLRPGAEFHSGVGSFSWFS